jgi:glycosyltransferase involved in cell wall biosynthesis
MPKVSVIVPNYNHARYLQQRIDSILNQTYQDFELILLDDYSTDHSREILLSYKENPKVTKIVFNEQNSGSTFKQWNKGIEMAQGEYIWIAESDDWAEPELLETLLHFMSANPSVGLAYTLSKFIDFDGEILWRENETGQFMIYSGNQYIHDKLLINNSIANMSAVVFRKELYKKINHALYDNMILCGDWYFYVLLCEHTDVLEYQKALNHYRIHLANVSSKAEKEGMSFLEGIEILDYICDHYHSVKSSAYSLKYARYWLTNRRQYSFTKETNKLIKKTFAKRHKRILLFYVLLSLKRSVFNLNIFRKRLH